MIIPVYNEERTVPSIVEIVRGWGKAKEIAVVDDGSTDGSVKALRHFRKPVRIISQKNKGQGAAIATGIDHTDGDVLLFIDGDLTALTYKDLDALVSPVLNGKADMAIGALHYSQVAGFEPFNEVSGTRVVLRKNIIRHIRAIRKSAYGVTVTFNMIHKNKRVVYVRLPHVFVLGKFDKQAVPEAVRAYIIEASELLGEAVRQQAKEIPPQVASMIRGITRYLKSALDYFQ